MLGIQKWTESSALRKLNLKWSRLNLFCLKDVSEHIKASIHFYSLVSLSGDARVLLIRTSHQLNFDHVRLYVFKGDKYTLKFLIQLKYFVSSLPAVNGYCNPPYFTESLNNIRHNISALSWWRTHSATTNHSICLKLYLDAKINPDTIVLCKLIYTGHRINSAQQLFQKPLKSIC